MSDQMPSDNPLANRDPALPHVVVVQSPQGGFIGIMHLGETVRAFAGAEIGRIRDLMSKVGISEFRLPQAKADDLADDAVDQHEHDAAAASNTAGALTAAERDAHTAALEDLADAQAVNRSLNDQLASLQSDRDALKLNCEQLVATNGELQADVARLSALIPQPGAEEYPFDPNKPLPDHRSADPSAVQRAPEA
jgi:hypothetical protein